MNKFILEMRLGYGIMLVEIEDPLRNLKYPLVYARSTTQKIEHIAIVLSIVAKWLSCWGIPRLHHKLCIKITLQSFEPQI
jgi:hypothetical protein